MVTEMARSPLSQSKSRRGPCFFGICRFNFKWLGKMLFTMVATYVTSATKYHSRGRPPIVCLLWNTIRTRVALRIESGCEGYCLASVASRLMNLFSDLPEVVFEPLRSGWEFPSPKASGNDHGLNPHTDCRMDITDESTPDTCKDHAVKTDMDVANLQCAANHYKHESKQSATHRICLTGHVHDTCDIHSSADNPSCYIGGTCHLNPPELCPPDVIVVETSGTSHRNSTAKSAICEEKHAENPVEDHVGTAMSDCRNPLTLPSDSDTLEHKRGKEESNFQPLHEEIQIEIIKALPYEIQFQLKLVSKGLKRLTGSEIFRNSIPKSCALSQLFLHIRNGEIQLSGIDVVSKKWRPLPTLRCLPSPGQNQFKEYLLSSSGGLLCANVSKSVECERVVVCNPMTQTQMVLPPLSFRRNPVLLHMSVNRNTNSFTIIAAGSSGMADGHLSRKTEVFNSLTSKWEVTGDIPGCEFGLNEYQTGVCVDGILYCVAFLEDASAKGVLAYDVKQSKWLSDWRISLPCPEYSNSFSIAQVVECDNEVYLFSERETGHTVEHRIDRLDSTDRATGVGKWTNVVRENKTGGRGLLIYPEYACVGFGVGKLCIFNTLEHTGKVYDIRHGGPPEHLPPPQSKGVEVFHTLNPLSFTFEPNFKSLVEVDEAQYEL